MISLKKTSLKIALILLLVRALENARGRSYLYRPILYRKGNSAAIYRWDLNSDFVSFSCAIAQSWLEDEEFLSKYRVSRKAFHHMHDLTKDHPVFISKGKKQHMPVEHQLLIWLKYVGTEGTGASNANQRGTFEIGYGTAWNHRKRVTLAFRSIASQCIKWPEEEERKEIALEMIKKHDFPHCVMIADGTIFPLALVWLVFSSQVLSLSESTEPDNISIRLFSHSQSVAYPDKRIWFAHRTS
jgi:hypothetical protein